jgi:hypothetical protein
MTPFSFTLSSPVFQKNLLVLSRAVLKYSRISFELYLIGESSHKDQLRFKGRADRLQYGSEQEGKELLAAVLEDCTKYLKINRT